MCIRDRVGQKLSSRISTTSGVRLGCMLAPMLFCVAIDWIFQHMSFNPGITVGSLTLTDLVYADDTASSVGHGYYHNKPHHSRASVILLYI